MQVLAHPDPFVLEDELLRRVAAAQADDPLAPVLVIVPTARLARHVGRRLAERHGARLAVEILHHRALTLRILEETSGRTVRLASRLVLEALLGRVLAGLQENPWSRFLSKRPGAMGALMGTLTDLREASIAPEQVSGILSGSALERGLAEIYDGYVRALDQAASRGFLDDASLVCQALPLAAIFAAPRRAILHHGAYELIGIHLDLIRELDRTRSLAFLLPVEPGAPAFATAEGFAMRHLLDPGKRIVRIEDREGGLLGQRLAALYDESAAPTRLPPAAVRFRHTQGVLAEVTLAARHALEVVAEGVPPHEVAILAPSLFPYAPALEEVLDGENVPWTSPIQVPLRRDPAVHDLLLLLHVAALDFPRAATSELLASPRLRWDRILPDEPPPRGDLAEAWSRRAGILMGLDEWKENLPAWAEGLGEPRVHDARNLARALETLSGRVDTRRSQTWRGHADTIEDLLRGVLPGIGDSPPTPALKALLDLLEQMRDLPAAFGEERDVSFPEMLAWLTRAVDGTEISLRSEPAGGIQVLDAMQARGLTFRRVLLLGLHAGLFPRAPRPDPFLEDEARLKLRETSLRPLSVRLEREKEERLLLSLLLGAARESIDISWQRADEAGRSRTPSLALREVARLVLGAPELQRVKDEARGFSAHPTRWLEELARDVGLLAPAEASLLSALSARTPEQAAAAFASGPADLLPRLRMLCSTESFAPDDMSYDGRVDPAHALAPAYSVAAFEALGRCPLQYFFRHVLRVRELDEEPDLFQPAAREVGDRVHRILESLYRRLMAEGLFEPGRARELRERAAALVASEWDEALASLQARLTRHVPVLGRLQRDRWLSSLGTFLREDLERMSSGHLRPLSFEEPRSSRLSLGRGIEAEVNGRLDRILVGEDGTIVGDYKTSGGLSRRADIKAMLRGRALQVPLYRMLAGPLSRVELLGVGPDYDPQAKDPDEEERIEFAGFEEPAQEEGFLETLRALVSLARAGRFPLNPDSHCSWCDYRSACRQNHPPTLERREHAWDSRDFLDLQKKEKRKPTLAAVRSGAVEADS